VSLLSIEDVSKRYRRGLREYQALDGVSLAIECGALVVVLGSRKSGRSTLLRIAAGLERADGGIVCFEGTPLRKAREVVGRKLSYCHTSFSPLEGEKAVQHVAATLLAQGFPSARAMRAAQHALARVGAEKCAWMYPDELTAVETVRVAIARALVPAPKMLVIDDPTAGVGSLHGDAVLGLLRSTADEGVAVLMSTDDATCISGADRVVSLEGGRVRGEVQGASADVVPLHPPKGELQPGARLA
jgi:putative ABC transport system ATP-binding protein